MTPSDTASGNLLDDDLLMDIDSTPDNTNEPNSLLPPSTVADIPEPPSFNPDEFTKTPPTANNPDLTKPAYEEGQGSGLDATSGDYITGLPPSTMSDHGALGGDPMDEEKKRRKRAITAKWVVRLSNRIQDLGSTLFYDYMNQPKKVMARKRELDRKVVAEGLSDEEKIEFSALKDITEGFMQRRMKFHETCSMEADLVEDATEMLNDILEVEGSEQNPMAVFILLMAVTPAMNLLNVLIENQQHKKAF